MRTILLSLCLGVVAFGGVVGCGETQTTNTPPTNDAAPDTANPIPRPADVGADAAVCSPATPHEWAITAADIETSCVADSDCQAVYLGDDACEVADVDGAQSSPCPNAAASVSSYNATYLPKYEAINHACRKACSRTGSILCANTPVFCNAGTCALR